MVVFVMSVPLDPPSRILGGVTVPWAGAPRFSVGQEGGPQIWPVGATKLLQLAEMVTLPVPTHVTLPTESTVATELSEVVHPLVLGEKYCPEQSSAPPDNVMLLPTTQLKGFG